MLPSDTALSTEINKFTSDTNILDMIKQTDHTSDIIISEFNENTENTENTEKYLNSKNKQNKENNRNNKLTPFAKRTVYIPAATDIMSLLENHSNVIEDKSIEAVYSIAEDLSEIEDIMEAENNIEYYFATTDDEKDLQMDTLHDAMVLCLSKKNIQILHLISGIYYEKFVKDDCPSCKRGGGYIPSGTKEFINNLFHNGGDSIDKRFGGMNI